MDSTWAELTVLSETERYLKAASLYYCIELNKSSTNQLILMVAAYSQLCLSRIIA